MAADAGIRAGGRVAGADDVIVIGGGIAGCATACYLARDGVRVRLVERASVNGLASSANAGSLHAQIPHDPFRHLGADWARSFSPAVRLFIASLGLWKTLEDDLGADLEIGFGGGLLVGADATEMAEIEAKAEIERAAGLPVELLDERAVRARAPYLAPKIMGGAFCPIEGKANPLLVATAYAAAARAAGAVIETHGGPATIRRDGPLYTVAAGGRAWQAPRIVIAAGSETGTLAAALGARLAIEAFPIQVSVTEPAEPLVPHLVYCAGEKLTMKQTRVGSILIGGGWAADLDQAGRPVVSIDNLSRNLAVACGVVPGIAGLRLVRSWAAFVNGTADWLPILGELPQSPGAFINYVPWMGFTGGPAAARSIASQVQGRPCPLGLDLDAFSPRGG
jgi:glycine/D-amino acid oxidase-like deaminating enzyme